MASPGQDHSQHQMMDEMIQISKELSELNCEKKAHAKVKHQLLCCIKETKSCMERVEAASSGTIMVLQQLISHNQNVEKEVAFNHQCLAIQKEVQVTEMQDWKQRTSELATNIGRLESLALTIQNRMLLAQNTQLRNEKCKKMSKTQTNQGKVQIQKLEEHVGNVQTQLDHEKRELTSKLSNFNSFLENSFCGQKSEAEIAEVKTAEKAAMNGKETQQIMARILSSQTELKKAMNESQQQNKRNQEVQQELELDLEQQTSNVFETNNSEAISAKLET